VTRCANWDTLKGKTFDTSSDQTRDRWAAFPTWPPSYRLKVDLMVTWYTPAAQAQAAKQATRETPIVMALAANPIETGLVQSLARPGGNITGMAAIASELAGKNVELMRHAALGAPHCGACQCARSIREAVRRTHPDCRHSLRDGG
jgi:ABC transporter substrate binding protein